MPSPLSPKNNTKNYTMKSKCPNFGLSECKMVGCPFHDTSMKTNEPSREIGWEIDIEKAVSEGQKDMRDNYNPKKPTII